MILKKDESRACPFCGVFGCEEDEFNFYVHPNSKSKLIELRRKVSLLPLGSRDRDDYAISKKLKSERGVVMPAYGKLCEAWEWMKKLEESPVPAELLTLEM